MRLAVLSSSDSWYLQDLRRAAGPSHEIVGVTWRRLGADLGGPASRTIFRR